MPRILFILLATLWATTALASQTTQDDEQFCSDATCFQLSAHLGGEILPLLGTGTFKYWGFRVYTAALYGPKESQSTSAILAEVPKVLVIHYHRSIGPARFIESAYDTILQNPANDMSQLAASIERINTSYKQVRENDRYAIKYLPGEYFKLYFNDELLLELDDGYFAKAYFGIWLSNHSISRDLTDSLLGRAV
ncbi:chalcone isomerase family protein [Oligoflexia bacterium]|nr:chalcone isomerase family protein [Oligoflexia bacterium]